MELCEINKHGSVPLNFRDIFGYPLTMCPMCGWRGTDTSQGKDYTLPLLRWQKGAEFGV